MKTEQMPYNRPIWAEERDLSNTINKQLMAQRLKRQGIRLIGDSLNSQTDSTTASAVGGTSAQVSRYMKMMAWVYGLTHGGFEYETMLSYKTNRRQGSNSAVGGYKFSDVLAILPAVLAKMKEEYLFCRCGTNDINSGVPFETLIANAAEFIMTTLAAGVQPIMSTVIARDPTSTEPGSFGIWSNSAGGTTTEQKKVLVARYNTWLMEFCQAQGVICVDLHRLQLTTAGDLKPNLTSEGLHPYAKHGYNEAKEFLRVTGITAVKSGFRMSDFNNIYNAVSNPTGNALAGAFAATGGATSSAGGGALTGSVPIGFRLTKSNSSTISAVSSVIDDPDGNGKIWQIVFSNTTAGPGTITFLLEYWSGSSTSLSNFYNAGDYAKMTGFIEISAHNGLLRSIGPSVQQSSGISVTAADISVSGSSKKIISAGSGFSAFTAALFPCYVVVTGGLNQGVHKCISADAGYLQFDSDASLVNESAGTSIKVELLPMRASSNATAEIFPTEAIPEYLASTPVLHSHIGGNVAARFVAYLDQGITDTVTIKIRAPVLRKFGVVPEVLSMDAHDN